MIKRRIDRVLSEGEGKQLAWLTGIVLALFVIFYIVGKAFWGLDWTDILTLYLDPGNFPIDHRANDFFSLTVTLCGILILSALMISVFSNVFSNIAEAYRKGERRYRFDGHVLIIGSNYMLEDMLRAIGADAAFDGKDIVVMTEADVEPLREEMETRLDDSRLTARITWYRSDRRSRGHLLEARADRASAIYLIGEEDENGHDALNIACLDLLRDICAGPGPAIPCFVTLDMHSSLDVFNHMPRESGSRLRAEIVNTSDYTAEQLLVNTGFLPVPGPDEDRYLHLVIAGSTDTARAFAQVAAQICHFPGFASRGLRTRITFLDSGMRAAMDNYTANHQGLFELSRYSYVTPDGREDFKPGRRSGDFLDVEWEFVDSYISSPFARKLLCEWAADPARMLVVALCFDDSAVNASAALHLPKDLYRAGIPIAVYLKEHPELMEKAISTGQFGNIRCFGEACPGSDPLFARRSLRGKRVNYLYNLEYGNPPAANADDAWAGISHAHKFSSIASANSIPLKLRAFGLEATRESIDSLSADILESLSEVEHRRWMLSVLLMGNSEHPDIVPYSKLAHEADKDRLIVNNIPYIINNEAIVR